MLVNKSAELIKTNIFLGMCHQLLAILTEELVANFYAIAAYIKGWGLFEPLHHSAPCSCKKCFEMGKANEKTLPRDPFIEIL